MRGVHWNQQNYEWGLQEQIAWTDRHCIRTVFIHEQLSTYWISYNSLIALQTDLLSLNVIVNLFYIEYFNWVIVYVDIYSFDSHGFHISYELGMFYYETDKLQYLARNSDSVHLQQSPPFGIWSISGVKSAEFHMPMAIRLGMPELWLQECKMTEIDLWEDLWR